MSVSTPSVRSSPLSTSSRSSGSMSAPSTPSSRASSFEIEPLSSKASSTASPRRRKQSGDKDCEAALRACVSLLTSAKARPFSVSGKIPLEPSNLTLFFRTKGGITHSLDFPIDIDHDMPPSLEVLIAASRPHSPSGLEQFSEHDSLFYPPHLPLTTNLEIANHPILDAVRNTLFPALPSGHYLTVLRDKLQIWLKGSGMRPRAHPNDMRVATILVTLPVKFRGGSLVVRAPTSQVVGASREGPSEERYHARGTKVGEMEWTAFLADCDHEIEPITKGMRITISYAVHVRSFGTASVHPQAGPDPLINPSDRFLDLLCPVLNLSRGRRIAFHLTGDYDVDPVESLAECLVPHLKGGDSVLYHALRLYKLSPELLWTAGGYAWRVDQTVDLTAPGDRSPMSMSPYMHARATLRQSPSPTMRGSSMSDSGESSSSDSNDLRTRVMRSGALPLAGAGITLMTDPSSLGCVSKARVPFVRDGEVEKLVVNILMSVFVP